MATTLSQPAPTPTSQSLQPSSSPSSSSSSSSCISSDQHLTPTPSSSSSSSPSPLQHPIPISRAASSSPIKDVTIRASLHPVVPSPPTSSPSRQQNINLQHHHDDRPRTLRKHRSDIIASPVAKQNRGGIFNLAALAREKTSSAIAGLAEPSIRSRRSSGSLYWTAQTSPVGESHQNNTFGGRSGHPVSGSGWVNSNSPSARTGSTPPQTNSHARSETWTSSSTATTLLETNPPSQAYSNTARDTPAPIVIASQSKSNKMHQTSSRLLRMTSDERPFTRDFKDLFSTLVVSLPLQAHRVRLTRIEHSFLSEEAINNLGSLKFSQSNRMPDPKDPSRIVTTTTTTTFSMAREMARSVCQRFLDARFIESADGKQARDFTMKSSVWQLTPKGIHILERFCSKNGIQQKHVAELIGSSRNTMQLVILERDTASDKLSSDRGTIEVIFRRFVGTNGPNIKQSTNSADSDSLSEYKDGIAGVRMANERKIGSPPRTMYHTFTGKAATDWLMDCCSTVDRRETSEIATLFLEYELMWCVQIDRSFLASVGAQEKDAKTLFAPTKNAIYQMTQKGKDVVNMTSRERVSESSGDASTAVTRPGVSRDSNTQKLDKILLDPALRLLFRENLRDTHCEENLSFYLDVDEFLKSCRGAIKANSPTRSAKGGSGGNLDAVKETMASAYGIYNAFLAPGSPCELNIDHLLRNQLATRMTKAVGQDGAMVDSLREVTKLFEEAQLSVFKLMASDSVPKFMKSSKYEQTLKNYDFDSITPRFSNITLPERSLSRSNR